MPEGDSSCLCLIRGDPWLGRQRAAEGGVHRRAAGAGILPRGGNAHGRGHRLGRLPAAPAGPAAKWAPAAAIPGRRRHVQSHPRQRRHRGEFAQPLMINGILVFSHACPYS